MNTRNFMTLLSIFIVTILLSCNNAFENEDETVTLIKTKWEIADFNSGFTSFEFTEDGNFIVVENIISANLNTHKSTLFQQHLNLNAQKDTRASSSIFSSIHFGIYQIEENTINLFGFGSIKISSITADNFSFSFTLESTGENRTITASKTKELITQSDRTNMFCRTWTINKVIINENLLPEADKSWYEYEYGQNWKEEAEKELLGTVVVFTKAGTYLISYTDKEPKTVLSWWKWANKEETAIYYSEDNWQDNWQGNITLINELTNTTCTMQEKESISYELELFKK